MTSSTEPPSEPARHTDIASIDQWPELARWTMWLIRDLSVESHQDPRPLPQRFLDAISIRFEAEGTLRVTHTGLENATVEIARFVSTSHAALLRAVDLADAHEWISVTDLADGRQAALTLRRPERAPSISAFEADWIQLLHERCGWVYAPALKDTRGRLERLSPRERQALAELLKGASEKEVALALNRSRHTVHSYVKRIYRTLGVRSRAELRVVFGDVLKDVLGDFDRRETIDKPADDDLLPSSSE